MEKAFSTLEDVIDAPVGGQSKSRQFDKGSAPEKPSDFTARLLKNWSDPNFTPQTSTLTGHQFPVVTCSVLGDNYIFTSDCEGVIRVYNLSQKKFYLNLTDHFGGGVWSLKYKNGLLISDSSDKSLRVWNIEGGFCTHVFKGHHKSIRCIEVLEYMNEVYIVSGSMDGMILLWKLPSKEKLDTQSQVFPIIYDMTENNPYFVGELKGHTSTIRSMSGYGNIFVSGSYDGTAMVWDIASMKCLYILAGHSDRIYCVIYDHKRSRCISSSMDKTVKVWDLEDLDKNSGHFETTISSYLCTKITDSMYTFRDHTQMVGFLSLSDKFLASGAADGVMIVWDADNYEKIFTHKTSNNNTITALDITKDILVSGSKSELCILSLTDGSQIHSNVVSDIDEVWSVNATHQYLVLSVEKHGQSFLEILDFDHCASRSQR